MKRQQRQKKLTKKRRVAGSILTLLATLLCASYVWLESYFSDLTMDKMVFQMKVPMEGTGVGIIFNYLMYAVPPCLIMGGLLFLLLRQKKNPSEKQNRTAETEEQSEDEVKEKVKEEQTEKTKAEVKEKKWKFGTVMYEWLRNHIVAVSSVFLIGTICFGLLHYDIPTYLYDQTHPSRLYETSYVNPDDTKIIFPEKKRNLIYIFLESFENTFASKEYGGFQEENLLPNLTQLQREKDSVHFTQPGGYGMIEMANCSWTMASMVAQTSGVPLSIPLANNGYDMYTTFLPGLTTIGEILDEQGYHQKFLIGSEAAFAGTDHYYEQHGGYEIMDYNYALEQGWIPEDYYEWWGFEDKKLFEFAKKELEQLAAEDEPFNLTMATMDTHCVEGYVCEKCGDAYDEQYYNVIACADSQLSQFVEWVKEQPWYENTTIILCGDHLTMDARYADSVDEDFNRSIFQVIVNPAVEPKKTEDRLYSALDMFPTTLAALGAEIEGEYLGLGVNLFSDQPTLCEKMGTEELADQIKQTSRYYNNNFLFAKPKK
ncbi:MAG: LTA synthase family protein [Eubacteriales bacterium]|nr:LTA synthase family protein [Eubacteriales bacterium]